MSGKDILVSTFVSFVIISAVGYVALPALYPALQNTSTTTPTTPTDTDTDLGKVIQIKHIEVSSQASILDDDNATFIKIPDTGFNITVSANSVIDTTFTTPYLFGVGSGASSRRFGFDVVVVIEGVGNQTIFLTSYNSGTTSNYYEYSSTMYIQYISPKLTAGTYSINVYYKSTFKDPANTAYLTLSLAQINNTRTLSAMELR